MALLDFRTDIAAVSRMGDDTTFAGLVTGCGPGGAAAVMVEYLAMGARMGAGGPATPAADFAVNGTRAFVAVPILPLSAAGDTAEKRLLQLTSTSLTARTAGGRASVGRPQTPGMHFDTILGASVLVASLSLLTGRTQLATRSRFNETAGALLLGRSDIADGAGSGTGLPSVPSADNAINGASVSVALLLVKGGRACLAAAGGLSVVGAGAFLVTTAA